MPSKHSSSYFLSRVDFGLHQWCSVHSRITPDGGKPCTMLGVESGSIICKENSFICTITLVPKHRHKFRAAYFPKVEQENKLASECD